MLLDSWPPETRRCPVPFLPESSTLGSTGKLLWMFWPKCSQFGWVQYENVVYLHNSKSTHCIPTGVALIMIIEAELLTFEGPNILLNSGNMAWNWAAGRKCMFLTGCVGGYGKFTCWLPLKHGCTVALSLKSETGSGRNCYFYTGVPKQIHQIC